MGMLEQYADAFANLRPNRTQGKVSPHKASLLLAVIDLIEQGAYSGAKITYDQRLKDAFSERFAQFRSGTDKDDPAQPFFYLSSSSFWSLHPRLGQEQELEACLSQRRHGSEAKVKRMIAHAVLEPELFKLMQSPIARAQLAQVLEASLLSPKERFEAWAHSIGKSPKTVTNYVGALNGSLNTSARDAGLIPCDLFALPTGQAVRQVLEQLSSVEAFRSRDTRGKGMYSAALKLFSTFLEQDTGERIAADIREIEQDVTLDQTERDVLVTARRGQGIFRDRLMAHWRSRCSVTQYTDPRFLVASHIRPWRSSDNQQRLDRYNGLLLIPNLDKAFDLGLISFSSAGGVLIADHLDTPEVLGINDRLKIEVHRQCQPYLEYHRAEVYNRI